MTSRRQGAAAPRKTERTCLAEVSALQKTSCGHLGRHRQTDPGDSDGSIQYANCDFLRDGPIHETFTYGLIVAIRNGDIATAIAICVPVFWRALRSIRQVCLRTLVAVFAAEQRFLTAHTQFYKSSLSCVENPSLPSSSQHTHSLLRLR